MDPTHASISTQLKVGFFTVVGLVLIGAVTLAVGGKPFWWRPCQPVNISVEDATGLKAKSPIRSLGIEIGYLKSVMLAETHVTLGICITAPVEVLPTTRAYLRGEGFLGDKFVELRPIKYVGPVPADPNLPNNLKNSSPSPGAGSPRSSSSGTSRAFHHKTLFALATLWSWVVPSAHAERPPSREIPVGGQAQDIQDLVKHVNQLVNQMSGLTNNLNAAIKPEELRSAMRQLNETLLTASKTLAPEGGLNQTAQRSLAKLEDAIEQLRDLMTRVNKGEGSLGMLINDPEYAKDIRTAIVSVNRLLNRVAEVKFMIDLGGTFMTGTSGGRGWFQLGIWPKPDRYYLLGVAFDPRGRISLSTVSTTVGGVTRDVQTQINDQTSILFTAMLGKVFFNRFDAAVGALYGDGAFSLGIRLGPNGSEDSIVLKNDVYVRTANASVDDRITLTVQPFSKVYLRAGLESIRPLPGSNQMSFVFGGGLTFEDEDIKLLFALR